jgi:hypothetical protein
MLWGNYALGLILIVIIIGIILYIKNKNEKENINYTENFLALDETNFYMKSTDPTKANDNKPVDIQYQIPVTANQLSTKELQSIDTDVLRNVRNLANFSMTDEFNFYQMYSIIKKLKNTTYNFNYEPLDDDEKSKILPSEKIIANNSGAINNTDLELFSRLKLELISAFNSLIIKNGLLVPYHPFQFFKIINSNMISNKLLNTNSYNFVFTLTFAREYKFQQFVIYYDVDLIPNTTAPKSLLPNTINYNINLNKVELIGIPIPNTIEFHPNQKTIFKTNETISSNSIINDDYYYEDQVSDSADFDVMPVGSKSIRVNSPNIKYIDIIETTDMDNTIFDKSSLSNKITDRIMNVARDQQYNKHRCYGLVDGVSKELPQYKNPIFCKSYHPEINQNGIWDAPCQINNDCPFYKANKNYPNEFGKCNKESGQCEMPFGVIPIGFTKFGKTEPNCYNCGANSLDSKCCSFQADSIKSGKVKYRSPDFIFGGDESNRKQFENEIKSIGLLVNPSI